MNRRMLRSRLRMAGLAILLWAGGSDLTAAMVRGRVVNNRNFPVPGFAIRVVSARIGPSNFTFSGPDGMYYLQGIPPGPYILEFWYGNRLIRQFQIFVQEPQIDIVPQMM